MCHGSFCGLTTTFAVHINGTKNRHFNHHMIFCYCDEAQASLCKCADSSEPSMPAHAILTKICLCKCKDSPEPSLHSQKSIKSTFEPARYF